MSTHPAGAWNQLPVVTLRGWLGHVVTSPVDTSLSVSGLVVGLVTSELVRWDLVGLLTVDTVSVPAGQAGGLRLAKEASVPSEPAGTPVAWGHLHNSNPGRFAALRDGGRWGHLHMR